MPALLEIEKVSQDFRSGFWLKRKRVLHEVTLQIEPGTIVGILGPNGAGKTTLIHLIAGIRQPTEGSVRIRGVEASIPRSRENLGFLPERPYFPDHLTGEMLLRFLGKLSGLSNSTMGERIPKILERVGMTSAAHTELKHYSKGMLQRIGIAQAILHDPEFLLLDEPMSGLDPVGRQEIRDLILSLHGEGRTIFFSTHLVEDADSFCHQVALIQHGKLVGFGPLDQIAGHSMKKFEIRLGSIDVSAFTVDQFPGSTFESVPGGVRIRAYDADKILAYALSKGAKVKSVEEFRPSLEKFFRGRGNA